MSSHIANDGFAMLKPEMFLKGKKKAKAVAEDAASEYIQKIPNPDDPEEGGGKKKRKGGKKNRKNRKKVHND